MKDQPDPRDQPDQQVSEEVRVHQVQLVHLEDLDLKDLLELQERKELLGRKDQSVPLDVMASKARSVSQDQLDPRVYQERMVIRVKLENMDIKEQREPKESKVPLAHLDLKDLLDSLVLMEMMVKQVLEVSRGRSVPKEIQEPEDSPELQVQLDYRVYQVHQVRKVRLEMLDHWVLLVLRVPVALLAPVVQMDLKGLLVGWEIQVLLEKRVNRVKLDHLVLGVSQERRAQEVNEVRKEKLVIQGLLVLQVEKDLMVMMDLKETLVLWVSLVILVLLEKWGQGDKMVQRETEEKMVNREKRVLRDFLERMDQSGLLEREVLKEPEAQRDAKARKEVRVDLELLGLQERLAQWVHKVLKESQALKG